MLFSLELADCHSTFLTGKAERCFLFQKMEKSHQNLPPHRPNTTRSGRSCSHGDLAVSVVFPGLVTRESCSRFTCELIKHILHQRHQLPLPYDQLLVFSRKQQSSEDSVCKRPKVGDSGSRQCQKALLDLDELLSQLEVLFTLTSVPRVLLLLGGNPMSPKELYEINMEGVHVGSGEQSLSTRPCLRQIFHSLFLADPFSDLRSSSLMTLAVMALAHRDCGTEWFRPKLYYKVPNRGHVVTVKLSCSEPQTLEQGSDDYIWFQAPVIVKGFHH
ncbi:MAD2L1-binding [Pelobates cultripes]|uniref:MAD2L1-binding n=2 Tax=Pelobates cultripes TaxID=61616 RepID=A0AAD1RKP7_PELCU|nr:MAD2L1-binding [Pelobates cultripes]